MKTAIFASVVSAAVAGGTLSLTWKDCGSESTHAKATGLTPASLDLGTDTAITGTGDLKKKVSGGTYEMDLKAGRGLIHSHFTGNNCDQKDFNLPLGLGTLSWDGLSCPLKPANGVKIGFHTKLAAALPAALATSNIHLEAVDQDNEQVLCVDLTLAKQDPLPKAAVASSLGDRLVLEIHYTQQYQELPLTITDAQAVGWEVSEDCVPGLGRRAQSDSYLDLWDGRHGALHLWYDKSGSAMGFGLSAEHGVAAPWKKVGDHFEIDFLTRDPEAACGDGPPAQKGSIGDRLVMVGTDGNVTAMPLTLQGAFDEKYNDGGPCFPDMGWHMMLDRFQVSTPTPVYSGADGSLLAMNLNSYEEQQTPSSEYPAPKEGKAVYGWHVYFKEHEGACDGSPTAYALPFAETPAENANTDFRCTPYFGNLWVQTLTTVVDLHASGSVCQDAGVDGECKFVHFMGPNKNLAGGTLCVPPAPTDGCHCYHQVTYTEKCEQQITSSNASGALDTSDAFDDKGVLRDCSEDVVNNVIVGWAPPAENPTLCDCEGVATVQV